MKYIGKEYKWFKILFTDGKPDGVELYGNCPWGYRGEHNKVSTYWENELLTDKPNFDYMEKNQRLARKATIHLEHMINLSQNDEDLMFRLSGFYGTLVEVLKENKD